MAEASEDEFARISTLRRQLRVIAAISLIYGGKSDSHEAGTSVWVIFGTTSCSIRE
jgi:hypothetical protein